MTAKNNPQDGGRVDADGTVYVTDNGTERTVGQYPDGTPEEALAYYGHKYDDLETQTSLLEARIARGTANLQITESVAKLAEQVAEPAAVGDLQTLRERVAALSEKANEFAETQKAEREEAKEKALAAREAIVAEAEAIVAQPKEKIRWKESGQAFTELFEKWQNEQRTGPHLPKSQADALWKRFRTARNTFEDGRRRYFAELDARNKAVKDQKERLITAAEKLADQGADAIGSYRKLLDEWKTAGRSSRKIDDALWARFKAAGDVLYGARASEQAAIDEEFQGNLEKKEALLGEAEVLLKETDHKTARAQLTEFQIRWDEIGRVPREKVSTVEGRMRAIEKHVKELEDAHWQATNPETIARSEGLKGQLEESLEKLEKELAETSDAKKKAELEEALQAQRAWLAALGN
ncbi:MAG: DUF349 domain-containing protein [Microbacteriaceae bacterium]|nr:DUF349 domain-containing protein [Microbacteriaceae bacterium]